MMEETLETKVGRLEGEAPIALDQVDLTVHDPARLRRTFAEVFGYIATVEGSVPQNVADITALLPDLDRMDERFLAVWSGHELAHAAVFDALRAELGLASPATTTPPAATTPPGPAPAADATRPRPSFRIFGVAARVAWLADVFKLVYLARGAMHEHLTYDCYRRLGVQLSAIGEHALASTVFDPIRRQEAAHLGYYRQAASIQRQRLTPAQLALARSVSIRTYAPVGSAPCGRELAGRVFAEVAREHRDESLDAVQALADQLLGEAGRPLPPFVHEVMDRCMEPPRRRSAPARSLRGEPAVPAGSIGS